ALGMYKSNDDYDDDDDDDENDDDDKRAAALWESYFNTMTPYDQSAWNIAIF
ncbi:MAG: hypothetical protein GY840_23775, partial [Pseudoalteromonas sp.]|nr:hypothetical protein [Pseudoalteromonas sp.]